MKSTAHKRSAPGALAVGLVGLCMILLRPGDARAQDGRALFEAGLAASSRGDVAAACDLFERSHALLPAVGSLLNVAGCQQERGELVLAYNQFTEAAARAERESKADRADVATARARSLEDKVARLKVALSGPLLGGESLWVDGQQGPTFLTRPVAVEPGAHTVEIRFGDRVVRRTSGDVRAGSLVTVHFGAAASATAKDDAPGASTRAGGARGLVPWLTLGTGLAALGASGVTGVLALAKKGDAQEAFDGGRAADANRLVDDGRTVAAVSTATAIAGLLLTGLGVYLFVDAPTKAGVTSQSQRIIDKALNGTF